MPSIEACLLRFRPIMMTTMAALLGGLPLAFGTGFGSELRRPLGIAMVGGLLLSQVLTLYTTPVIYIFFDNLAQRFSRSVEAQRIGRRRARRAGGAGMNISAPFIHRPVATTLLTVAIALAGAIAFKVLPVSPLPQVDFPTISVSARPAGSQRRDHGLVRRHSAGAAVRPHRRRHGDDFVEQLWAARRSRFSSTSAATSTAQRATWKPPSMPRALICPPIFPAIPTIARSIRPMRPS